MEKQEINERIKEKYALNETLEEDEVKKEDKKLYKEAVNIYGSWDKALKSNGIIKRNLREREKFILYSVMKRRYEMYGEEVLRPKNVQPETVKERIVEAFKTLKALTNTILNWDEEKVLYELRAEFLTGHTIEEVERSNPELYEQMMYHFKNLEHVKEEYNKRFGMGVEFVIGDLEDEIREEMTRKPKEIQVKKQTKRSVDDDALIDMLVKLNYLKNEEEINHIKEASEITREEMISYIFTSLADVSKKGTKLTEEYIRKDNPAMLFAIRAEFGTVEKAFNEMKEKLLQIG